jgi:hypothetical protein
MAVKHVKRLTAEEYDDRMEYLMGAAAVDLAKARDLPWLPEVLRRIQHAAQECALYVSEEADA